MRSFEKTQQKSRKFFVNNILSKSNKKTCQELTTTKEKKRLSSMFTCYKETHPSIRRKLIYNRASLTAEAKPFAVFHSTL